MEMQQQPSKKSKPSLPEDLIWSCLARVPRLYYPTLSLVSKSFGSLIASPELYRTRSLLHRTEGCLYVCLRNSPDSNPRWFTLCRKPDQTLTKTKTKTKEEISCNLLVPIPIINSPNPEWSNIVSVGSNLYAINGLIDDAPSSNVSFLDCRTHTWLEAPSLRLAHTNTPLDGKLYLAGNSEKPESLNCIEVFDTKTQTWKPVPPEKRVYNKDLQGKIYMIGSVYTGMAIKANDFTWESVSLRWKKNFPCVCTIGDLSISYSGMFRWLDTGKEEVGARIVKGLEGLPKFARYSTVRLANCGGKLMVLWDKYVTGSKYKKKKMMMIWCAEISIEKRSSVEIWGKVEWFDSVLTVPKGYNFVCVTSATL